MPKQPVRQPEQLFRRTWDELVAFNDRKMSKKVRRQWTAVAPLLWATLGAAMGLYDARRVSGLDKAAAMKDVRGKP